MGDERGALRVMKITCMQFDTPGYVRDITSHLRWWAQPLRIINLFLSKSFVVAASYRVQRCDPALVPTSARRSERSPVVLAPCAVLSSAACKFMTATSFSHVA